MEDNKTTTKKSGGLRTVGMVKEIYEKVSLKLPHPASAGCHLSAQCLAQPLQNDPSISYLLKSPSPSVCSSTEGSWSATSCQELNQEKP